MARRKQTRRITARALPKAPRSTLGTRTIVLAALGVLLLIGGLGWYLQSGGWARITRNLYSATASAGLRIDEVFITGRTFVNRDELLETIGVKRGDPILALDLPAIHERLAENRWLKSARVERHLPNILFIALEERKPFALWQNEQKLAIVDANGYVISRAGVDDFSHLPLLVGVGANLTGANMLTLLDPFPEFSRNLKALIRVSDRRWDVLLKSDITIKLPENDPAAALERVAGLWQSANLAERKIKVIDARLPDRVIIDGADQPTDEGTEGKPG